MSFSYGVLFFEVERDDVVEAARTIGWSSKRKAFTRACPFSHQQPVGHPASRPWTEDGSERGTLSPLRGPPGVIVDFRQRAAAASAPH
jgi:hypothetical protein